MVDFSNTEIAYSHLSNNQLKKTGIILKFISNEKIVGLSKRIFHIVKFLRLPYKWLVKKTIFYHFVGGQTIGECEEAINILHKKRVHTILDYSAEGVESEQYFEETKQNILATLRKAKDDKRICFGVFKFTGLCSSGLLEKISKNQFLSEKELDEWNKALSRCNEIFSYAEKNNISVLVDAEESWLNDGIEKMIQHFMPVFNKNKPIIFLTIQFYLKDGIEKLNYFIDFARKNSLYVGFKLVRGAYIEKENIRAKKLNYASPILSSKELTDENYNRAIEICLKNIDFVSLCIATHNENSCKKTIELMKDYNLLSDDKRIWFAQLYGMSDYITFNLSHAGYNVAKYLPFGPIEKTIPYLIRRAEENSSIISQTHKDINYIKAEIKRRKI